MNNFDKSSTGTNIELSIHFDCCASQSLFDESIQKVNDMFVYTSHGLIDASDYSKAFDINCSASKLFNLYFEQVFEKDFSLATKDDCEMLKDELGMDVDDSTDMDTLAYAIKNHAGGSKDYDAFLDKHFAPKFFTLTSRGYSQGDLHEVIVPFELLTKFGIPTTQESADSCQGDIDHLFWDAPIQSILTVDGENHYLHNDLSDIYSYSQDEIAKVAGNLFSDDKTKANVMKFLVENLPSELQYIH